MKKLFIAAAITASIVSCKKESSEIAKAPEELYMIQIEEVDKDGITTTPAPVITVHVQP